MRTAEAEAMDRGAEHVHIDINDFQALTFTNGSGTTGAADVPHPGVGTGSVGGGCMVRGGREKEHSDGTQRRI